MADAPKRIWAWEFTPEEQNEWLRGGWDIEPVRNATPYTRTDIADELVEALERIEKCMRVNYGRQNEKIADITQLATAALAKYRT